MLETKNSKLKQRTTLTNDGSRVKVIVEYVRTRALLEPPNRVYPTTRGLR